MELPFPLPCASVHSDSGRESNIHLPTRATARKEGGRSFDNTSGSIPELRR